MPPLDEAPAAAARAFLRSHPPFDRCAEDALAFAVRRLSLAYFPKDAVILAPESGPVAHLYVIRRGLVGSRAEDPRAEPDPPLAPGELFPVGALSAGGASARTYHAIRDTFCLRLARADFIELRRRSPEFDRYCTQATTETLKQSLAQLHAQYGQLAAEQQTLMRPVGELTRRAPVACRADATLAAALPLMQEHDVRTLAVVDAANRPIGILTLVDVLHRVVLPQRPLATPIGEVMTQPVVALPATASAYEALQAMAEHAVRQICVVDGGTLVGIVNERDLFALTRVSMRQVQDGLRAATSIELLKRSAFDVRGLMRTLLAQGMAAEPLMRTVSALNDAVMRRAIDLVASRHDTADARWCWLALGSEGRGEQMFATDQHNALAFEPADGADVEAARTRLVAMAREANAALAELGFPLCRSDTMAGNPALCLTLGEWEARLAEWLSASARASLPRACMMLDFRPLHGDAALGVRLRDVLLARAPHEPAFLRALAQSALAQTPPLGRVRPFASDDEHGTVDLKTRGTRLFVDAARVFAMAFAIRDTATAARLRAAAPRLAIALLDAEAIVEAFQFLQMLRLRQQDFGPGSGPADRIAPDSLNEIDRRMLKEALRQARTLQRHVREGWPT